MRFLLIFFLYGNTCAYFPGKCMNDIRVEQYGTWEDSMRAYERQRVENNKSTEQLKHSGHLGIPFSCRMSA